MCRCNRITEYKTKCNMILWCGEKKVNKVLNYISDKTNNEINNKIFKFDAKNKEIIKYNNNNLQNNIMFKDSVLITLLKQHTNIDDDFIDIFFKEYKIGGDLDFNIKDIDVAKYLGTSLNTIRRRLNNTFSKNINFVERADYIKIKTNKTSGITYMINYQCFERLTMSGDSEKSEIVRMFFIKLREFLIKNHI